MNDVYVRGGGLCQATIERAFFGGSADWRKVLLNREEISDSTATEHEGSAWRAWRAIEEVVGFCASARKADAVEMTIRQMMRATPTVHAATFSGQTRDANDSVISLCVIEELRAALIGSSPDFEYLIFADAHSAREALKAVQATYMCRSLWLGAARGSVWWQGFAAGSGNFRERVEAVEKEIFCLGGDGKALLEVALNGVGVTSHKRRKGTQGEVMESDLTLGKVRKFLAAFIDKKTPKPRNTPHAGVPEKNSLKKWLKAVPKDDTN